MKNSIACGLVLALMVCAVPAAAFLQAFDDYMTPPNGDCMGGNGPLYIGNVLENDPVVSTPVTVEIIKESENGYVLFSQKPADMRWNAGDLIYDLNEPVPIGTNTTIHDSIQYRLYNPQTGEYSNTVTVNIDPVRFVNIPDRTVLHTPEDTELILRGFKDMGCFGEVGWETEIMDGPDHGNVAFGYDTDYENPGWPFRYIPDAGFTGWDHLGYRCITGVTPSEYGYCYSQISELWISVGSEPYPSPEFPSALLPVILLAGFLGSVLLIRRTREK